MKPLTKMKQEKKFTIKTTEVKLTPSLAKPVKKNAQCCAKSSSIVSGCHD
jgi:hypothetical protein